MHPKIVKLVGVCDEAIALHKTHSRNFFLIGILNSLNCITPLEDVFLLNHPLWILILIPFGATIATVMFVLARRERRRRNTWQALRHGVMMFDASRTVQQAMTNAQQVEACFRDLGVPIPPLDEN